MDANQLIKAVPPELVKEVYSDAVADTLKEAGKIGVDLVKTVRLALFPIQFGAMLQDRLARHLRSSIERVPPARRIAPVESLALQIADKLRYQEEGSVLTEMYVNLLARAMDKERASEAHPAFLHTISQLAPDEALLVDQLSRADPSLYVRMKGRDAAMLAKERANAIEHSDLAEELKMQIPLISVRPEELGQPDLLHTYIEHLVSLGLVSYTNEHQWVSTTRMVKCSIAGCQFLFIRLNGFGKLFYRGCLPGQTRG
ncbi:Abi-alpha family protein [Ralstonia solanacearum]|uniref:DUF4393 domain-containing protein n=1 Tax=Ralstonia solanacearum CFBP2957 TaxID=859656 RepID=D8P5X9_RALSL|nr:Abi-alpha family protein [Ralstonia solanacearum]CBJ54315.1 protein of unknown function [Ralstonia solanacearum CFBP2957]